MEENLKPSGRCYGKAGISTVDGRGSGSGKSEGQGNSCGEGYGVGEAPLASADADPPWYYSNIEYYGTSGAGLARGQGHEEGYGGEELCDIQTMCHSDGEGVYVIQGSVIYSVHRDPPPEYRWTLEEAEAALAVRLLGGDDNTYDGDR